MRNRQLLITAFLFVSFFFGPASAWQALSPQVDSSSHGDRQISRAAPGRAGSIAARQSASGKQNRPVVSPKDAVAAGTWTLIGPQPLIGPAGGVSTGTRPHSGLINAAAVDPRNADVVYLGAAGGGVWKTTDGGQPWIPLTDNQPSLEIQSLALDPTNPDIVYAGTTVSNTLSGNLGAGILKSSDGGSTWTQLPGPLPTGSGLQAIAWSLAVSPSDDNVVLAVAASSGPGAVYRSADGGNTWTQVIAPNTVGAGQVLFDPGNGNIAYASLGGVYKSTDGGNTWASVNGTGSSVLPTGNFLALAIAASSPETLYAGGDFIPSGSTGANIMFKTVDGGQSWTTLTLPPTWACWDVVVDPVDADIVFVGTAGLGWSMDGGQTWTWLDAGGVGYHGGMAFSPDGNTLYLGSEWGAWKESGFTNGTLTLTNLNATLAITEFFGIAIHPTKPAISLGGTASNGVAMYAGTLSWQSVGECDNGGADAAFDFMNPSTIYITCIPGPAILKSTDGGQTFSAAQNGIDASELVGSPLALAMDPTDPQRLYLAAKHVWQSNDGAANWTSISGQLGGVTSNIQALAVAPTDPNTVYWGNSGGVYVTTNAKSGSGATWTSISAGLPLGATCNSGTARLWLPHADRG